MLYVAITCRDVNRFEWFDRRKDALHWLSVLQKQGITAYCGGKRAHNPFVYRDIKIAAILHNAWNGYDYPWVVAWKELN